MEPIHLGDLLKNYLDSNKIYKSSLARKLNKADNVILYYQKQASLQTSILFELCHALKHNFFQDIAAQLPNNYTTSVPEDHQKDDTIAQLEQQILILQAEKEVLLQAFKK